MSKKKIAIVLASTALIASLVIGGTLAYLTDTDTKTNTFTMGDVDIRLDEVWNPQDGVDVVPGDSFTKRPTVVAVDGDSYMRIKMEIFDTNGTADITDDVLILNQDRVDLILSTITDMNIIKFTAVKTAAAPGIIFYNYNGIFLENTTVDLFSNITILSSYDKDDMAALGSYKIVLAAQAIQSTGFANAADAFAELDLAI